jgi:anti-sigma factor RsiW
MSQVHVLDAHPDDDGMEAFAMGRAELALRNRIELHLLSCSACRDRYIEIEEFVRAIRSTLESPLDSDSQADSLRSAG